MKTLYIEGHSIRDGFVVCLEYYGVVRKYKTHNITKIRNIVDRFNRMQPNKNDED